MRFKFSSRAMAATLAVVLFSAANPAAAQQTVASFNTANVIEALTAVGITDGQAKKGSSPTGAPFDYVSFSTGGIRHVAILEVCSTGTSGCLGLNLLTIWNEAGAVIDRNKVNDFNASFSFGKGFVAGNSLIFQRYAISDGGVSKQNVQSNIGNFVVLGQKFAQYVSGSGSAGTISAKPGEAALSRASASLSPEAASIMQIMGEDHPNVWNAPSAAASYDGAEHASPK